MSNQSYLEKSYMKCSSVLAWLGVNAHYNIFRISWEYLKSFKHLKQFKQFMHSKCFRILTQKFFMKKKNFSTKIYLQQKKNEGKNGKWKTKERKSFNWKQNYVNYKNCENTERKNDLSCFVEHLKSSSTKLIIFIFLQIFNGSMYRHGVYIELLVGSHKFIKLNWNHKTSMKISNEMNSKNSENWKHPIIPISNNRVIINFDWHSKWNFSAISFAKFDCA